MAPAGLRLLGRFALEAALKGELDDAAKLLWLLQARRRKGDESAKAHSSATVPSSGTKFWLACAPSA